MTRGLALWLFVALTASVLLGGAAQAKTLNTEVGLREVLAERNSPMDEVAHHPVYFWRSHPDFDIAGWMAVVWAETNLGRDSFTRKTNNVGCIRGGKLGRPWRDWRVGTTSGGFNTYPTLSLGVRASIRLVYAAYNDDLKHHRWDKFAARYWGPGYPASYVETLKKAHALIVSDMRAKGFKW